MELLNLKDIFKAPPVLALPGGEYFTRFLMYILRFNKLNRIYEEIASKKGLDFIDEIIRVLEFKIDIEEHELRRVPATGPVIVVANHPYGGFDSLLLIKFLSQIRPDVKIMGNFLMQKVRPVAGYFVSNQNLEPHECGGKNFISGKADEATAHLQSGGVLCIFPSGGLTTYGTFDTITDKVWQFPVVKFIRSARVPVIPIHFQGTNSRLYHLAAKIHPSLSQVRLSSELLS